MEIPKSYLEDLIQILEWRLQTFHDPELPKDEFVIWGERLIEILYQKKIDEIDQRYLNYLSHSVQTANTYADECGVEKNKLEAIYDWIMPIYLNR